MPRPDSSVLPPTVLTVSAVFCLFTTLTMIEQSGTRIWEFRNIINQTEIVLYILCLIQVSVHAFLRNLVRRVYGAENVGVASEHMIRILYNSIEFKYFFHPL